jgi:hypothetical protein
MPTRKTWRPGLVLLAAFVLLVVTSEDGYPQAPLPVPTIAPPMPSLPANHVALAPVPHQQAPTVEQLLDQITAVRAQKAELEKREQALVGTLRMKLAAQKERLTKLGIAESAPSPRPLVGDVPPPVILSK